MPTGRIRHDLGIRTKLRLLVAVAVAGLALFAAVTFKTISEVKAGSAAFLRNRVAGEVSRDFGSPSQAIISVYPSFFQSRNISDPADMERLNLVLHRAHASLEAGHKRYLEVLDPGRLRDLVTVDAYDSAEAWFAVAEKEYMPAVERGDWELADKVRRTKMEPLFQRNSASNEEIARLAAAWMTANRSEVAKAVRSRTWQLLAVGVATFVAQVLLGIIIDMRVGTSTRHLQATLEELRNKNAEVEAFVYTVSHDLRSPLVNLQGFSRELETSCIELQKIVSLAQLPEDLHSRVAAILDSDVSGAIGFISAATSRLERSIDSLLRLSRQGRQPYQHAPIDALVLVQGTVASLRAEIEQADASFVIDDLPNFAGDRAAFGIVFANLFNNAIKYRDRDRALVVRVSGRREKAMAHIWVTDNGVGIPAAAMPRLFKVFQRLHPSMAPGEGMGLVIGQRILERHGGRIWVESTAGAGATFHFTVPISRPAITFPALHEVQI